MLQKAGEEWLKVSLTGVFVMTNFTSTWAGTARPALGLHHSDLQWIFLEMFLLCDSVDTNDGFSSALKVTGNVDAILKGDAYLCKK